MKIYFENKEPEKALQDIQNALIGRKLGKLVTFDLHDNDLTVTIHKMGKSHLEFSYKNTINGKMEWELTSEKIALAHRAFKNEVMEKLIKIVNSIGGEVVN